MSSPSRPLNPFCTQRVQPAAAEYLFPSAVTADQLARRVRALGGRAEIVGPHGSGKSTLVHTLCPPLEDQGWEVRLVAPTAGSAPPPSAQIVPGEADHRSLVIVDGYERLSPFTRWLLRWKTRGRCGLVVTAHRRTGLPRLWTTHVSAELAERVVERLIRPYPDAVFVTSAVRDALSRHRGDLREALFDLYDLYEARYR